MNQPQRADSVRGELRGDVPYVHLDDLARRLKLSCEMDQEARRCRVDLPGGRLIFTALTSFVWADGELRQMALPAAGGDGLPVPVAPLVELMAGRYAGEVIFDPSRRRLLVSPSQYDILGARFQSSSRGTLVFLTAGKLLECKVDAGRDGSVTLSFPGAAADTARLNRLPVEGAVRQLIAEQDRRIARIKIVPDSGAVFIGLNRESDPPLFIAEFRSDAGAALTPKPAFESTLAQDRDRWALDVVVIDPGHGGRDPGAVGATGTLEKEIALDVALKLRKVLQERGVKTVMTRDRDVFIPLDERGQIANSNNGKLFVSLHCNSAVDARAYGMETYFLAPTKSERAMRVAMRENSVIKYEESRDKYRDLTEENFILLAMAQAGFMKESQTLAGMLQTSVSAGVGLKDRGVDQAGFYVLIGASMPAVLFEMGFLSNRDEERKLKDGRFRQKIAQHIADTVVEFLKHHESKID